MTHSLRSLWRKHGGTPPPALILILTSLITFSSPSMADGHRNVHYYSSPQLDPVRWDLLTHLVYFGSGIDGNGAFIPHTEEEKSDIARLQNEAKTHGKVLMASYIVDYSYFKAMLEDDTKRAAFITAMSNTVTTLKLDGVDLDWEYPENADEFSLMDTFCTELRSELGPKPLISAAVASWQVQMSPNTVNESLDWIQTMGYYWRTNSQSAADLANWTNAGVAKSKICLGVPFAGKSHDATVPWDIPYHQFVNSISPFDPNANDVYFAPYTGNFNFVGVNLQKEKVRTAAAGGGGSMVWHHTTDVWDPERSLAVSLHDETVRHVAVIDSFELPVDISANHLYAAESAPIKGTYARVGGFTGAQATLSFSGAQWSQSNLTSLDHPTGYAFPSGAQIRFDYKVLDAHAGIVFYLRLFDSSREWIQHPVWNALDSTGWKRATFDRSGFSSNASFDENDVRRYQILAQSNGAESAFTARVVYDNLVMIAPDPARRPIEDRDADGCSDRLENHLGTSSIDAAATPASPFTGLHAWWKLDNNFSHTAREENQRVHGKVWGASWVAGISNYALQFDGVDDKMLIDSSAALAGAGPFSLSLWIKTTDTDGGMILQQRISNTTNGQYRLRCTPDGTVNFSIHNNGYQFDFASTTTINDGHWHQITAIRDGANGTIYIDGQLDAQDSGPIKSLVGMEVAVGYDHRDQNNFLEGTIDDIRIYSKAVSTTDISDTDHDQLNDQWEIQQLGNLTTGVSASDDPDGDGFSLFKEMAFGGNANTPETSQDFTSHTLIDDNATPKWQFSFRRPKNYERLNLSYQLQHSSSLQPDRWTNESTAPLSVQDDADGTSEWVTFQLPMNTGDSKKFYRCHASSN